MGRVWLMKDPEHHTPELTFFSRPLRIEEEQCNQGLHCKKIQPDTGVEERQEDNEVKVRRTIRSLLYKDKKRMIGAIFIRLWVRNDQK